MPTHQPMNLRRADYYYTRYFEIIPPGIPLADVINADYWINVRRAMRVNDVMEVVAADGSYEADLRVVMVNHVSGAIKFRVIREMTAEPVKSETILDTDRYEIKHKAFGKWNVVERATGKVVAEGLDKEGAVAAKAAAEAERKAA